jgi:HlyD family secretion protein
MSATVDIRTTQVSNVITIPIQAVTTRKDTSVTEDSRAGTDMDEEDEKIEVVFVVVGEKVEMVKVETGIQNTMYIELKSGLTEGDKVVTAPYNLVSKILKDGQNVTVVDKKDLYTSKKK